MRTTPGQAETRFDPSPNTYHLLDLSTSTPVRVLILHDSLETAGLLVRELERGGFSPVFERVHSSETFKGALSEST